MVGAVAHFRALRSGEDHDLWNLGIFLHCATEPGLDPDAQTHVIPYMHLFHCHQADYTSLFNLTVIDDEL